MSRNSRYAFCALALLAAFVVPCARAVDFEVAGPDGRRVLLKDDGTWRYAEEKGRSAMGPESAAKPSAGGEAIVSLDRREEFGGGCRFAIELTNNFPHIIQSLIPTFLAIRANGVAFDGQTAAFIAVRPGVAQTREILFRGIACGEIVRLQIDGGNGCVMGELDRFSPRDGKCLAHVRVVPSDLVRFEK